MKVLLFSCSTGGGHNSAAAALAQELEARSVESRTYDALQFLPKSTADLISHGHDFAYRYAPKIYGAGYRREEKHPSSLFYEQSIRGIGPLYEELIDQAPDAVICVHLFPAMMMTELRCSYGVRIPTYFVATDFTCSPGVGDLQVDGLCIPHRDLIPEFVTAGLPQERLFPTGIPVGQQFLHPESREEARRALNLPVDGRILTLACGSMGAGPLRTTAQKVAELMGPEDLLVTICGSNHRMYQQMQSDFFRPVDRVRVLGYTHEMFRYMYASDLLLTKAGGLTTAEAVAAGLADYYKDAATVKECLRTLFVNDVSSARPDGSMEVVKVYWWRHNCKEGQYSSAKVHRSLEIRQKENVVTPGCPEDYDYILHPLAGLEPEVMDGV